MERVTSLIAHPLIQELNYARAVYVRTTVLFSQPKISQFNFLFVTQKIIHLKTEIHNTIPVLLTRSRRRRIRRVKIAGVRK